MEGARGWRRFLPGLAVLLRYDRSWLRGDVLAGLTVCAYLIPQVMAYAPIAGPPSAYTTRGAHVPHSPATACRPSLCAYAISCGIR